MESPKACIGLCEEPAFTLCSWDRIKHPPCDSLLEFSNYYLLRGGGAK